MGTERIVVAAIAGLALGLSLFAVFRPAPGGAEMGGEAFGAKVKNYLLENPQVIFEAATAYEQQEMENAQARLEAAIAEHGDRISELPGQFYAGNPDAEITIVEFFDYHCSYCKAAMPTLMKLAEENEDVRVRFMEFPILAKESEIASRAAIAAGEQGKYVPMHQAMMSARGTLSEKRIFAIAQDVGLDLEQLEADMNSEKTAEVLKAHRSFAEQVGFDGTPGIIVGNKAMTGWHEETIRQFITEMRKKKS